MDSGNEGEVDGRGYDASWCGLAAAEPSAGGLVSTSAALRGIELTSRSEARGLVFRSRGGVGAVDDAEGWRGCCADLAFSSQAARAVGSTGHEGWGASVGLPMPFIVFCCLLFHKQSVDEEM